MTGFFPPKAERFPPRQCTVWKLCDLELLSLHSTTVRVFGPGLSEFVAVQVVAAGCLVGCFGVDGHFGHVIFVLTGGSLTT